MKENMKSLRRKKILSMYEELDDISTKTLARYFGVSTHTIRRDLNHLEIDNSFHIYHGGAKKIIKNKSERIEPGISWVNDIIPLVFEGCGIYLEASCVSGHFVSCLPNIKIKIITNDVNVYRLIKGKNNISLFLFGSAFNEDCEIINSSQNHDNTLDSIDIAIIHSEYIDSNGFLLSKNLSSSTLNKLILEKAKHSFLIINKNSNGCIYKVCSINSFDKIFHSE